MSKPFVYDLPMMRDWFERHRHDKCHCSSGPPLVWAEYMDHLLTLLGHPAPPEETAEAPGTIREV